MEFALDRGRPGDERGFIHKKLLKFALPAIGGLAGGLFKGKTSATLPRSQTARPSEFSAAEKNLGRQLKFGGGRDQGDGDGCRIPGQRRDPGSGRCRFFLGERAGPDGGFDLGEPVLGQYGAGIAPGSMVVDRAVCGRGMQLGNDGVCYNKSQISNKQRMWPAGRRPLLSGGDMGAISKAAAAGKRLAGATKRLQRMGMMKKPATRRGSTQHSRLLEAHVTK